MSQLISRKSFVATFILLTCSAFCAAAEDWQQSPALQTTNASIQYRLATITRERTAPQRAAGLAMQVTAADELHLKSGLYVTAGQSSLPIGAQWDLGALKTADGKDLEIVKQDADWAHNRLSLGAGEDEPAVYLTLSRLTPAVLFESAGGGVTLNLPTTSLKAVLSDGKNTTAAAELSGTLVCNNMDVGWMLLYWDKPAAIEPPQYMRERMGTARVNLSERGFRSPLLLVFSEPTVTVKSGNGMTFNFKNKMVVMPLYGVGQGEGVSAADERVIERCDFWVKRMSNFPTTVRESYSYASDVDKVTVSQKVEFSEVRPGGVTFAPVPPMVALAKISGMPIIFDKEPADADYRTAYGPYWLIENAREFSWSVQGLSKYVANPPLPGPSNDRSKGLEAELNKEIDAVVAEDYLAPWIYETRRFGPMGNVYWRMPSETVYFLAQLLPVLDETYQQRVKEYLRQYCQHFPLLETASLSTLQGTRRERYNPGKDPFYVTQGAPDEVTFAVVRGLADYCSATDQKLPDQDWEKVAELMTESLAGSEWATGGWCLDKTPEPIKPGKRIHGTDLDLPTKIANRHVGNLVGMLRLARLCGKQDSPEAQAAWGRLARELAYRLALAKYAYWLSPPDGLQPFTADWDARSGANEVRTMNQFEVNCWDHTQDWRWSVYVAYLEMTPEVGLFLHDYAGNESVAFLEAVDRSWPLWWLANMTSEIGGDSSAGLVQPVNTYSLYMANAWIKGEDGPKLVKRTDVSWTARGDLFYMHKLSEAIKALRPVAQQSAQ